MSYPEVNPSLPARGAAIGPKLETAFNFRDEAFCDYMASTDVNLAPVSQLLGAANRMNTTTHPLVTYSAGWALAEAALRRPQRDRPNDFPVADRYECLEMADAYWDKAGHGFEQHAAEATAADQVKGLYSFAFTTAFTRATVPTMRLVAGWHCDIEASSTEIETARTFTDDALALLGVSVLTRLKDEQLSAKAVLQSRKLLAALLLNNSVTLVHDTPFRKKKQRSITKRSDFTSVYRSSPHTDIPVSILKPGERPRGNKFCIDTRYDMVIQRLNVQQVLAMYVDQHQGTASLSEQEAVRRSRAKLCNRFEDISSRVVRRRALHAQGNPGNQER